ncbi:MAG: hypothetical protein U1F11_10645 [Steroidobacteraceae bacterium]
MYELRFVRSLACSVVALLALVASPVASAEVVNADLDRLIDESAPHATRFAVEVPHPVSITEAGTWKQEGSRVRWTYSITIPTAVSLSFHAARAKLPADAVLTVTGGTGISVSYRARDVARSGLWSRPLPGDTLQLSLTLDASSRPLAVLQIEAFQAGYRGLGGGVPDHPRYRHYALRAAATGGCTVNYSCEATPANSGPSRSTVAILVGNVAQCTGTLLNDTGGDLVPYVLTARHCQNGVAGGGDPGAAANVTVYWDAATPCGGDLGSIYDGSAITQTGATTVVEQQDLWLIRLDAPPAASDAYFAGWDATGGTFVGGYSIHHALGLDRQIVDWYGQALLETLPASSTGLGFSSTFWGLVNATGSVGAGASGGALFDPNGRVVGSGSLALLTNGQGSAGVCPAAPPLAPTADNVTALYTALSPVWQAATDSTSSTGNSTLRTVLDAGGTGRLVEDGVALLPVTLTADKSGASTGDPLTLTWQAPGADSCTASGGSAGDDWAGTRGTAGSFALTEQAGGGVTYTIRCTAAGAAGVASLYVVWQLVPAIANVSGVGTPVYAGGHILLQWVSNTGPCTATGGTTGDGWAGTKARIGSQSVLVSALGSVTYSLTCGTGGRIATGEYTTEVVPPTVSPIYADTNQLRIGQPVNLDFWTGGACTKSGGSSGDGWAGALAATGPGSESGYAPSVTATVPGTYTYTVTCTGAGPTAGVSASSSVTLTFVGGAPAGQFTANPSSVEIYTDPGASTSVLALAWSSNVRPCVVSWSGPGNTSGTVNGLDVGKPTGTAQDAQAIAGTYVYTLTCGSGQDQFQASTSVNWYTNAPSVNLVVGNPAPRGAPWTVSWQTNVNPCTATGGTAGDGWSGALPITSIGYRSVTEASLGSVTFGITCGGGAQTVQAQATTEVVQPVATISANVNSLPAGSPVTISWNANFDGCTMSISPGGGGGTGLPRSGGFLTSQWIAGTYTYTINCAGAQASTQVTFTGSLLTLSASVATSPVNSPVTLNWNSPYSNGSCTGSGGTSGDGWAGSGSLPTSGSRTVISLVATTVTYSISCDYGIGQAAAQVQVTYQPLSAEDPTVNTPEASITANASSQDVGKSITLSWSSTYASSCFASGGASGDDWSGNLPTSGTRSITETRAGTYTFGIVCTGFPPAAIAKTVVSFVDSGTGSGGGSGGGGGGGAMDPSSLLLLGLAKWLGRRSRSPRAR